MRLIDGDALEIALCGAGYEHFKAGGNPAIPVRIPVREAMDICENAPAVEAVPLEWLRQRREKMLATGNDTGEQAIAYVLWLWEKENGNGKAD